MYGIQTFLDFDATWETFSTGEHEDAVGGVRTWKLLDDLDRYALAVERSQPQVVVEVGTKWGGSALWFASQPGVERVITIDIDPEPSCDLRLDPDEPGGWTARHRSKIDFVVGNSADPAVFNAVRGAVADRRCLVSLDGEHAAPHVADEIALYSQLVQPGQYLVVEDGIFDLAGPERSHLGGARIPAEGGPLRAIWWTLARDPLWERDLAIEQNSPKTYHPHGFMRRVG